MLSEESNRVAQVRHALAADPDVGPDVDRIAVTPGDPWRISGEVASVAARRKAVRVASEALPSVDFADEVRLARRTRRSDEVLARATRAAIRAESAFADIPLIQPGAHPPAANRRWLGVLVHDGVVYLGGRLNPAGRALAEALAWETGACSDVVNLISREPADPGQAIDAAAAEAIQILVARHPGLLGRRLDVDADHGEVTLRGTVGDAQQRALALGLCWLIPEVRAVHDLLKLDDGSASRDQPGRWWSRRSP